MRHQSRGSALNRNRGIDRRYRHVRGFETRNPFNSITCGADQQWHRAGGPDVAARCIIKSADKRFYPEDLQLPRQ